MTGEVNRALKLGLSLYCDKACAGLGRRKNKSKEQKVAEKREYDMEYRRKNRALLKAKKAAWFQQSYDPEKAAIERKKNMARHVEYCRRPEYKAWKKEYDCQYRAKQDYGEFWESAVILIKLDNELDEKMSWYDRQMAKGTLNKANQRRRDYERESSSR